MTHIRLSVETALSSPSAPHKSQQGLLFDRKPSFMFNPEEKHEIQISWLSAKCLCGGGKHGKGLALAT